jgi:biopolymer transport protein ExbB/TolQ
MLASSFIDLHWEGGIIFMTPLSILFASNILISAYLLITLFQKRQFHEKWLEAIKQIGLLAAVWGILGTIIGLFQAFDALEAMKEMVSFQILMGGLKVAVITSMYGLTIFCISMLAYIILKLIGTKS